MAWGNRDYWKSRRGDLYAEQQEIRRRSGQQSYALQEAWLLSRLDERVAAGRRARVLDFGVGFGRLAHLLAGREGIDYHGFDISHEMVAPLLRDPPAGLGDPGARILIGESLADAGPGLDFDVVFTVSVLIHNTPEQAAAILADMTASLAPGGEIWLIENSPVLFSMLDNVWHDGCWVHDIAFTTAPELDVEIDTHAVPGHGVYRLRRPEGGATRTVAWREQDGAPTLLSRETYLARALSRTEQAVRGLESEMAGVGPGIGATRDDAELYRRANAISAERLKQAGIEHDGSAADDLRAPVSRLIDGFVNAVEQARELEQEVHSVVARLEHAETARTEAERALRRRQDLFRAVVDAGTEHRDAQPPMRRSGHDGVHATAMRFDSVRDTRLAQVVGGFERVCHVMHSEWFGIRAAAGALPGHKLAISSLQTPPTSDIDHALAWLSDNRVDRIVIHGFSEPMAALVRGFAAAGVEHVSLVWHGAPAMWMHEAERRLFFLALSMARQGKLRRIHGMRAGTDAVLGRWGWKRQLLNMPPNVPERPRMPPGRGGRVAFAPSWNLLHKNLTTNVLGAVEAACIDQVWVLAEDFALPPDLHRKVKVLAKLDGMKMLETMRLADIVLNASIVDCHPMVELEALAVRTPAIRGRLWLDALEDHPYVRLTEVHDPLSIRAVAERISAVCAVPRSELDAMMDDYARRLIAISAERYAEFVEL